MNCAFFLTQICFSAIYIVLFNWHYIKLITRKVLEIGAPNSFSSIMRILQNRGTRAFPVEGGECSELLLKKSCASSREKATVTQSRINLLKKKNSASVGGGFWHINDYDTALPYKRCSQQRTRENVDPLHVSPISSRSPQGKQNCMPCPALFGPRTVTVSKDIWVIIIISLP